MKDHIDRSTWSSYLAEFNKRNQSRPTWLQVFGEAGAQSQEEGLYLTGISLEDKGHDAPRVQIMLDRIDSAKSHLTHSVSNLKRMRIHVGADGRDEAIEFIDRQGEASLLIFRHRARMAAHA